ncbi:NEK protein kinase [Plasmodium falciparum Tanzania (2000708)]|uniref:non-specific serine/threonine protein kinase n=1 Tax=Plasmodium falciparum Tanzania (2000708) TaxID=1036725 RepID=A0A024WB33_PLAFA|nr:NEK protein kinase [Plasmodium falciparum Tanzania (2000708)]
MSKPKMIGPYEVVKSIGRGSFGIVTAVKDENEKMYDKINNMDIKYLKCNNIFLDEKERAKIGDFGLAKFIEQTEQTNTLCGTIGYMAPEICKNINYSFPADIWSLGIILYELISLKPPFKSNNSNMLSVAQKICEDEPDPLPDSFSKDLINLCYWMLKKDWKDRPTIYDIISTDYIQDELQLFKREMLQERNSQI